MLYRFGISGIFMLLFLSVSVVFSGIAIWQGRAEAAAATPATIINGKWTPTYEHVFNKKLYTYNPSKDGWGIINYAMFREGNEGVLVGADNWLFTKEEFENQPAQTDQIRKNIEYIYAVRDYLAARKIQLVVAPLPSKARVYREYLGRYEYPLYKEGIYSDLLSDLSIRGIRTVNVLGAMQAYKRDKNLFLKTDTHWTPDGAKIAAQEIGRYINHEIKFPVTVSDFETVQNGEEEYSGDLLRYVPVGVLSTHLGLPPDNLPLYETALVSIEPSAGDAADALFSETAPDITLVGTSYSANPKWNFEGFLKEAVGTDILNAADEGLGPFETMDKYLKNKAFKETPPKLVIWEIPERYVSFDYNLSTDFQSNGV